MSLFLAPFTSLTQNFAHAKFRNKYECQSDAEYILCVDYGNGVMQNCLFLQKVPWTTQHNISFIFTM